MVDEFTRVKELPQAKIKESLETHVLEETSKEEPCYIMSEKNIEVKEKERVEEKERLIERLCILASISILAKESEDFECSKGKEGKLEKSERILKIQTKMTKESLPTRVEDKGRSMEKELGICLEDLPINPFLNPSLSFHEVSFEELKSLLCPSLELFRKVFLNNVARLLP
ncbi:hypothetical protein M9H77_31353 [Catharanthus roseus]|uniref:Uncharacterized protein n=1 Tax=Catharanthus roseus TaxID=4058 RepID=A0ACC0A3R9_CATRO|nr:hypothetical protein M9H77_31353 [Catharanthus roseus]